MKKLITITVALCLCVSSIFAFDANMEVCVNVPTDIGGIQVKRTKNDGTTVTLKDNQGGILIGGLVGADFMFNDIIGVGLDISLNGSPYYSKPIFAKKYESNNNNFIDYEDYVSINNPNWNKLDNKNHKYYMFDMSYFIGPALRIVKSDKMNFVLTPGLEYDYKYIAHFADNSFNSYYVLSELGTGVDIRMSFRLNRVVALNVGSLVSFSFFQGIAGAAYEKVGDTQNAYLIGNVNFMYNLKFTPRFGMAFYF